MVTGLGMVAVGGIWLATTTSNVAVIVIAMIPAPIAVALAPAVTSAMGAVYSAATYRYATRQPA